PLYKTLTLRTVGHMAYLDAIQRLSGERVAVLTTSVGSGGCWFGDDRVLSIQLDKVPSRNIRARSVKALVPTPNAGIFTGSLPACSRTGRPSAPGLCPDNIGKRDRALLPFSFAGAFRAQRAIRSCWSTIFRCVGPSLGRPTWAGLVRRFGRRGHRIGA